MSGVKFRKDENNKLKVPNQRKNGKVTIELEDQSKEESDEEEEVILFKLSEEDIDFIYDNTHYSLKDIKDWHRGFAKDCPNGKLYKQKVNEVYDEIVPNGNHKFFVDQIFRIFDQDANGYLDFKEFLIAIDMSINGSPEEKLRWGFRIFDKDGSGSIELKEMVRIMTCLLELEGIGKGAAKEKATEIFQYLDVNSDGRVELQEFVNGCLKNKELVGMLKKKTDTPKSVKPPDVCVVLVQDENNAEVR